jgi:hypothetical protein
LPFYDAARLIGVAHLFLGTANAEIQDRSLFWIIRGAALTLDRAQVTWIGDSVPGSRSRARLGDYSKTFAETSESAGSYFSDLDRVLTETGKDSPLKEMDAALMLGVRGADPLASYSRLAPETSDSKAKSSENSYEVQACAFGLGYAARAQFGKNNKVLILPIFEGHFVLNGFLDFRRTFKHVAGGDVSTIWAVLGMLNDLLGHDLPIADFAYNKEVERTFYEGGSLGFERLCRYWRNEPSRQVLHNVKIFLDKSQGLDKGSQGVDLARTLAHFAANPAVDELILIVRLKARLLAADSTGRYAPEVVAARTLFSESSIAKEAGEMSIEGNMLPDIPDKLTWALAKALDDAGKGWMNKFVRLENASTPDRFLAEVERIISRAAMKPDSRLVYQTFYSESGALTDAFTLGTRDFRAYKAVFLLHVLSKLRSGGPALLTETIELAEAPETVEEITDEEETE